MMIVEWILSGCITMPLLYGEQADYTLEDLKQLKKEAESIVSVRFDYARSNPTKEQPVAYEPPHRRFSWDRTWRTIGTQTTSFELTDWIQFQQFRCNSTGAHLE